MNDLATIEKEQIAEQDKLNSQISDLQVKVEAAKNEGAKAAAIQKNIAALLDVKV